MSDTITQEPMTVEVLNKKIAATIRFKDRMFFINNALKQGKPEKDLEMNVFEIETRTRKGNFSLINQDNGKTLKLFSWNLIKKSIAKIKSLRDEKAKLLELANMGMA